MAMSDFLLELGTEEIPAGYIQPALLQGAAFLKGYLDEHHLAYQDIKIYSTPRRMVFSVAGLPDKQADINKELAGPPCSVSFDKDNKPTPAYFGFIKKYNLKESDVKTKDTPKGKACYASVLVKGEKSEKILAEAVPGLVKSLPFPKSMWWEEKALTFARPLRYILACLGTKTLKVTIPGVASGNKTFGHPFLAPKAIVIKSADFTRYQSALRQVKVIVDPAERRALIAKDIQKALDKYNAVCDEPELLDEVTNLVEYPVAVECQFDESYLKLPAPVIESAMKSHQRYFPLKDRAGKLLNRFITVSNITANKEIKEGNERVIKARLSDALFFWEQDKKTPLEEYAKRLESIAFLGKLGTMKEKSSRLSNSASFIATSSGYESPKTIGLASDLCKADLLTGMVGEFPDLQGIMGYEYHKYKEADVATAIKEHYQPRFAGDKLPGSPAGIYLSLAEKLDNLLAAFSLAQKPTGSSDPYGLRRQALGIINIIIENKLRDFSFDNAWEFFFGVFAPSIKQYAPEVAKAYPGVKDLYEKIAQTGEIPDNYKKSLKGELDRFIDARFYQLLVEEIGIDSNIYNAVIWPTGCQEPQINKLYGSYVRVITLQKLSKESFWNELVEIVERTYNISKSIHDVIPNIDKSLLKEEAEIELHRLYEENNGAIQKLITNEKYEEASRMYHQVFAKPAHTFFEKVFVNVTGDEEKNRIRNNRLTLLKRINQLYSSGIADLSRIPRK